MTWAVNSVSHVWGPSAELCVSKKGLRVEVSGLGLTGTRIDEIP